MATVPINRRVASNPHKRTPKKASKTSMTAAAKKAFVDRMAKARKKSKNPSNATKKRKAKTKATGRKTNPHCKPRRKTNPTVFADPKSLAVNIVTAFLSAVATRQIPQMILKDKNKSWMGYLANGLTGAAATFAAHEFVGVSAAQFAAAGAGVTLVNRLLTEKLSPIGAYLSLTGLGDATAATSLGEISDGFYIHPTVYNADGTPLIPHEFTDAALAAFTKMQPAPAPVQKQIAMRGYADDPSTGMGAAPLNRFSSRY